MDPRKNTSDALDDSSLRSGEAEFLMPRGSRYAGQVVDVSSRRSIEIRPSGAAGELIDAKDSRCVVDFFYHEGTFWRAIVPLDGVDQVCAQAFNFSRPRTRRGENGREILFDKDGLPRRSNPMLNHVQSRFVLRPDQPVELYPLGNEEFGAPVHRIYDVIYSLETTGPVGVTFNIRDGLTGNAMSAHRFMSIQEMVFERLVVENQVVTESPPLPLKESKKRALLIASLLRSHRAGMTERYYLYRICGTNNCTSTPLQIVDHVVDYRWAQRIGSALYRLPLNPRFYLRVRGLDSDPSFRKLVRSEFEAYVADAKIQQRKRDYVRRQIRIRRAARDARAARP
jgi:hypothetical protein